MKRPSRLSWYIDRSSGIALSGKSFKLEYRTIKGSFPQLATQCIYFLTIDGWINFEDMFQDYQNPSELEISLFEIEIGVDVSDLWSYSCTHEEWESFKQKTVGRLNPAQLKLLNSAYERSAWR